MERVMRVAVIMAAVAVVFWGAGVWAAGSGGRGGGGGLLPNGTELDPVVAVDAEMANPYEAIMKGTMPAPLGALPIRAADGRTLAYAPPQTQAFATTPSRYWALAYNSDPADLKKFREDNAKLGLPKEGEERVVFMGDSITEGWQKTFATNFPGKTSYIGRGISSETTLQMLVRFRPDVVNLKAKVVVILAGVNDIAGNTGAVPDETIHDNFRSMVDLAKVNGIKVVLVSTLPATRLFWQPNVNPTQRVVELVKWQREFATENGLYFFDAHTTMKDENNGMSPKYSSDTVHPNAAGYELMSNLVRTQINRALQGGVPARP